MKKAVLTMLTMISLLCVAAVVAADTGTAASKAAKKNADSGKETVTLTVPFFSDRFSDIPVAVVNGDPITLEDLRQVLGARHKEVSEEEKKQGAAEGEKPAKIDFADTLRKLINVRLIIQEGRKMGIADLPEAKEAVQAFSRDTMRDMVQRKHTSNVKPDEAEVEKIYKVLSKEFKMKMVTFKDEKAADAFEKALKAGGKFDELAAKAFADKQGEAQEYDHMTTQDMLPQVAEVVSGMKAGDISPIVRIGAGKKGVHTGIIKLEDIRSAGGPETKERARQQVVTAQQYAALVKFNSALSKKYVKLDEKVFDSINYGSPKRSFDDWLKDRRVLARIKGDKPLTVGEFTEDVRKKYYHGLETEKQRKEVKKGDLVSIFESVVGKRILLLEAKKEGMDKTPEFREKVKKYEDQVVFGLFVQKVVVPDSKVTKDEIKAYYDGHMKDYTTPEMVNLSSLVFAKRPDAESALEKLRRGDDFQWVKENAEGQVVSDSKDEDPLKFDRKTLFVTDLPGELREIITGAKAGAYGLYASDDRYYVVSVRQIFPRKEEPLENVREAIARKLFAEKIEKTVEDWADKLRASSEIIIYLSDSR
jgi:hypothetical protein